MQQALTVLISAQVGATIAFLAFALLFGGGGHDGEIAAATAESPAE